MISINFRCGNGYRPYSFVPYSLILFLLSLNVLFCDVIGNQDERGAYVGCYPEKIDLYDAQVYAGNADSCVEICESSYFRYAVLSDNKCACATELDGEPLEKTICNVRCKRQKSQFCGGADSQSYYDTGVKVAGPPTNIRILNQSDTIISIRWNEAQQPSYVVNYMVKANVIQTFANSPLIRQSEWVVEKNDKQMELLDLHPGTVYNISVSSMCEKSECGTSYITGETLIGKPHPPPQEPTVVKETETTIIVDIPPAINNNGPVSYYRVIVMFVDDTLQQAFDEKRLASYNQSIEDGTPYYIAAELEYQNKTRRFTIGDGKTYRNYYNAPLPKERRHVHVSLGIVSIYKGIKKIRYAVGTHEQHTRGKITMDSEDGEPPILGLTIACVIFGILLVFSIIAYFYLRFKTGKRLHRLSDNHELTLQGPMVEVENNGYVPDENLKGNFRTQLNAILENVDNSQKFARNAIRLNIDNILAHGNFGDVISGKLYTNADSYDCQVHVVSDDMEAQDQTIFLKDLDQLIRTMPHDKFLSFYGVSASPDWFYLIFEMPPMILKKRLVEARVPPSIDTVRFSSISEENILQWVYDIAVAMEFLEVNKVQHKKLCSYNVHVTQLNQIKVSIFGPTRFGDQNKPIDISRWMAPEVLRFQHHSTKSDIWSFACLAWECCTLGATLYANITSQDLLPRIKNGGRPDQPSFIFSDLYQLFLNCWQLEPSERPDFEEIAFNVRQILTSPRHALSFDRQPNLFIPYYLPLLEMQN